MVGVVTLRGQRVHRDEYLVKESGGRDAPPCDVLDDRRGPPRPRPLIHDPPRAAQVRPELLEDRPDKVARLARPFAGRGAHLGRDGPHELERLDRALDQDRRDLGREGRDERGEGREGLAEDLCSLRADRVASASAGGGGRARTRARAARRTSSLCLVPTRQSLPDPCLKQLDDAPLHRQGVGNKDRQLPQRRLLRGIVACAAGCGRPPGGGAGTGSAS